MKASKVTTMFLLAAFAVVLASQSVEALSCLPTSPKVGVVDSYNLEDSYYQVSLRDVKAFDTSQVAQGGFFSLNAYESAVQEYLAGNLEEIESISMNTNSTTVPFDNEHKIDLEQGDILIQGPPFHVCDYRFVGIFSAQGELKYAVISDAYNDYIYNEMPIIIEPGEEIECDPRYCTVNVEYQVGQERFTLSPGESYSHKAFPFKYLTLLDSSDYNSQEYEIYDWGIGQYVSYIIDFTDNVETRKFPSLRVDAIDKEAVEQEDEANWYEQEKQEQFVKEKLEEKEREFFD